jgi:hypothetical protein
VNHKSGRLYRIDPDTKVIRRIPLDGGESLPSANGIVLRGATLYVVQTEEAVIAKVRLRDGYTRGRVVSRTGDPSFLYPTKIAVAGDRLLVVNSQLDKQRNGTPQLPFTVTSIPLP